MADLVKIIDGTEVGSPARDYSKLQDFENAYDGDDWSSDDNIVAQIRNVPDDAGTVYWKDWDGVTLDGTTHKIVIEAYSGEECDGKTDDGGGGKLEDRQYLFEDTNAFYIDYVNLELHVAGNNCIQLTDMGGGGTVQVLTCMLRDSTRGISIGVASVSACTVNVGGCLFKNLTHGILSADDDATFNIWNSTFYGMGDDGVDYANATIRNCAFGNITDEAIDHPPGTASEDYNSEDDSASEATCVNTNSTNGGTATDMWTDPGSDDFNVKDPNSDLYQNGDSGQPAWLPSADFAGTSWANPPSVGCFELAGGEPPTSIAILRRRRS